VKRGRSSLKPVPELLFQYMELENWLQNMFKNKCFVEGIEEWKDRADDNTLRDVYDGLIWKENDEFFRNHRNLGLGYYVDWFGVNERNVYSIGVIYLFVLNLPRNHRYLPKNVLVWGVIPGKKEPKLLINSYLDPLVRQLDDLGERGMKVNDNEIIKCKLLLICGDIPAIRKTCGFTSHNSSNPCSKCRIPLAALSDEKLYSKYIGKKYNDRMIE
jgi:hypothetical protein